MIENVVVKNLVTHSDKRGFFREIIRVTDDFFKEGFGQWSHSMMRQNVLKAWHVHKVQTDWWYVASGVLRVALYDARPGSRTYKETMELTMGDGQPMAALCIPPGVAHGCKCISGPAHLFYITSRVYDASDEGRIPYDDPKISYDWGKGPFIE